MQHDRSDSSGDDQRSRSVPPAARLALPILLAVSLLATPARAAENLKLAPGLSFTDDSSDRFPIVGDGLADGELAKGRPAILFFGAASCWNTNREAERLVALYPKFRDAMTFIVVDVNHPSEPQRALLAKHYQGYIPTLVVFAADGKVLYARSGETASGRGDSAALEKLIAQAIAR